MKRPVVFRWCSSFLWSKKYREYIERIELPWTLDNTGRWARFARSVLKKITMKLLQITTAWFITSCDNSFIAIVTGSYYKLRQVLYIEMMTAITNFDTITTDKITTEHCKEIFFNTNKFLTFTQSFFNPSRPFIMQWRLLLFEIVASFWPSRIFTLLLYERAVLTDTWVRKASPSLLV